MNQEEQYMRRCFELAQLGLGRVRTNPLVGCVIVHENKIIGEGFHERYGEGHAEVNALNSVPLDLRPLLSASTLYVTLEPCFHFGKTPPCVNLVLQHKIPKVVISCIDPNPKVSGNSIRKLRANGVDVISGVLEEEGRFLARRFFTKVEKKRPYVILKYAQSKDGFIGKPNEQVWITGAISKKLVHKWRSEEAGILIGTNTALVDNPQLNNRLWSGNSPIRIVLDRMKRLPTSLKVLDGSQPTIVFTAKKEYDISNKNTTYHTIDFNKNNLKQVLAILHEQKIMSIIVEGGQRVLDSFIQQNVWDEARVFEGNQYLGAGIKAPNLGAIQPKSVQQIGVDRLSVFYNL